MPDLLLELFGEEIPARMQRKAAEDLQKLVTDALVERGFVYEGASAYATPRRLALHVVGLPAKGRDVKDERKGPRVGAPQAAIDGFLKSAGLASLDEAVIQSDPKKGEFYLAVIARPGRPTPEVLAEIIPAIIRAFPWPKSMRWGEASRESGALRWVRPLHAILCTFGPETEEPDIVGFAVDGIAAGNVTFGHRFMAPAAIRVRRFDDYVAALGKARVVLDAGRRKDIILTDARNLAFAQGLELVEDEALAEEVAGLVEWPVVLMGTFDADFLAIPPEVIRATIRANQKCFVLRDAATAKLANRFILVANIEASDGGTAIAAGNARVVRARLSDAKFFWDTDRKVRLEDRLPNLGSIVFHEKLGTQGERVERIAVLAKELAPLVGADPKKAERAARLAKADLVSEMVGEFPELQGLMGRYYAAEQGEDPSVAAAVEEHYKPQGPNDRVPTDPVSVAVALADKLDTLVGFWTIDEKPTGSKDPFALRRAALGAIRLVLENGVRLSLVEAFTMTGSLVRAQKLLRTAREYEDWVSSTRQPFDRETKLDIRSIILFINSNEGVNNDKQLVEIKKLAEIDGLSLIVFLHDRLKVMLRDQGARYDLVDAVLATGSQISPASPNAAQDDLLMIVRRVEALGRFLDSEDGRNLLVGTKRAVNILRIEEKKDGTSYDAAPDPALLVEAAEIMLADALGTARQAASAAVAAEDFEGAMAALSRLRQPVDAFFDDVTVNADDPALRRNRLKLLAGIRSATREVADFSKIAG